MIDHISTFFSKYLTKELYILKKRSSTLQFLVIILIMACLLFSCDKGTVKQEKPVEIFINKDDLKDGKLLVTAIASKNMAIGIEVKHKDDIWDSACIYGEKKKKGTFEEWVSLVGPDGSPPEDGEYTIRILPKNDRTGERGYIFSVYLDSKVNPPPKITEPENNFKSKSSIITVKGTTENLSKVALIVNGKTQKEKIGPTFMFENVTLDKEVNEIYVEATDRAGNKAKSETITVIGLPPSLPPEPAIVSPRDGARFNPGQRELFIEGTAASGATVEVYINGEKQASGASVDGRFRVGRIMLRLGENTIYVLANGVKSKTITVFLEPMISSPRDKAKISHGQGLFVEGIAVSRTTVEVYINGEKKASGETSADGRFEVGPIMLRTGENTIYVLADEVKSKTITVSFIEPTGEIKLTINYPKDNHITNKQRETIEGTIEYKQINNLSSNLGIIKPDGNFQYSADLEKGKNTISFVISDRNNPTKKVERTITIIQDTIPPEFIYDGERTTQISFRKSRTTPVSVKVVDEHLSNVSASWSSVLNQPDKNAKEYQVEIKVAELKDKENRLTAVDSAGNESMLKLMEVPPLEVKVTAPNQNERINGNSVTVNGTITGYGNITVTVGNQTRTPSQGNFSAEVSLQNEGKNEITITAQDALEKSKPIVVAVVKDTTGPVFTYAGGKTTSIERWIAEGDFTVDISDEAGIADVTLNGKEVNITKDEKTVAITIKLKDLKQESRYLVGELTAKDLAKPANGAHLDIRVRRDDDILSKAIAERNNKNYQSAIDLFSKVPDSQQKNFLTAQWNIATLYLYYLNNPDNTLKAIQKIEEVVYEKTNKAAYLQLFKGLAHFYKGEDIRSKGVGQGRQVIKEYKAAAEAFENAFQNRSYFSKTDLGDVWYFGIDKNVSDTRGYAAMSYYYLYQWSKTLGNEEDAKNYKARAIARLQDYVDNLPFTVVDGQIMIPKARKPFYKLEDFKYLYESAKEATKELDTELAKSFK